MLEGMKRKWPKSVGSHTTGLCDVKLRSCEGMELPGMELPFQASGSAVRAQAELQSKAAAAGYGQQTEAVSLRMLGRSVERSMSRWNF